MHGGGRVVGNARLWPGDRSRNDRDFSNHPAVVTKTIKTRRFSVRRRARQIAEVRRECGEFEALVSPMCGLTEEELAYAPPAI